MYSCMQSIYIYTYSSTSWVLATLTAAPPFSPSHPSSLYLSHSIALSFPRSLPVQFCFGCLCRFGTLFYSVFCSRFHLQERGASPCRFPFLVLVLTALSFSLSLSAPETSLTLSLSQSVFPMHLPVAEGNRDLTLPSSSPPPPFPPPPPLPLSPLLHLSSSRFLTEG